MVSYLLVRSRITFQSLGKILSFIRFLNTQRIFNRNSWRKRKRRGKRESEEREGEMVRRRWREG